MKPEHIKRYSDIVKLLMKYGRSDLVRNLGVEGLDIGMESDEIVADARLEADPEAFVRDLERLGPTYIKLGQVLSTRGDFISERYLQALSRLQDNVEGIPFEDVKATIESELGIKLASAFDSFDERPLAAASLSQVHRARLRSGAEVVVKVQRPGIRKVILDDLEAFEEIAGLAQERTEAGRKYRVKDFILSFHRSIVEELNFQREAANLRRLAEITAEYPELVVPLPVDDFTTDRVLTMQYISGVKIETMSPVARMDMDTSGMARALSRAYLDQILVHGFIHADPHPGNVLLTPDGKLALIDLGMVTFLGPETRDRVMKLMLAINDNKPDEATRLLTEISKPERDADLQAFGQRVADIIQKNRTASIDEMKVGQVIADLARAGAENGVPPVTELSMTGKALLSLDQITRVLDPKFNPQQEVNDHIGSLIQKRTSQQLSPGNLAATMMDIYTLVQKMPGRINLLLDKLIERDLEVKVHVFDEKSFMANFQKIGNRIATGLVLAALIVGAALTMNIPTTFSLFGYPAISSVMFLLAAILGFFLVVRSLIEDSRDR